MNKHHLFRAWHKERCKMYGVRTLLWDIGIVKAVEVFSHDKNKLFEIFEYGEMEHVVLMQCTGLRDKVGTLIFAGDIVEFHRFIQTFPGGSRIWNDDGGEMPGVVEGEETYRGHIFYCIDSLSWKIKPINSNVAEQYDVEDFAIGFLDGIHEESFEIIGNIHDNPELPEVQNA